VWAGEISFKGGTFCGVVISSLFKKWAMLELNSCHGSSQGKRAKKSNELPNTQTSWSLLPPDTQACFIVSERTIIA